MKLTDFNEQDFENLYDFMKPIWLETYGPILPEEQILFLLEKYFSKEGLQKYRALGYQYRKINDDGVVVFVVRDMEVYMDKLYLLPSARGKRYPAFVFSELAKYGKDILLNANSHNTRAVNCYLKNGFSIEKSEDIDLGNGMINRDFVMRKKI